MFVCDYDNSVELTVQGAKYRWLVDTGASLSAVKLEAIQSWNLPIHPEHITVKGLCGRLETEGFVYIPLSIYDKVLTHKFYVFKNLPCIHDGIIGISNKV